MKARHLVPLIALAAVLGFGLYAAKTHHIQSTPNTTATSTKAGAANLYPNATLTPGNALPVDAKMVCQSGYSKSVRNVPETEKKQVYAEYGISYPQPTGSYEVDHFISLELGGSNDITNLWPEPALPTPGFHEKDKVENYLHQQVCNGSMSLKEAQREIATDWYAVYLKIA